ncbi:MAG: hypothetical protein B6I23_01395 [Rickettsiaceae bacterium 4572_127]|nr:MAG: hypothetical protein B6I23_01395 [Rickettsiaceae bacterium 4572_127]
MIRIPNKGIYKNDSKEAIDYLAKQKQACIEARTWQEKRVEGYGNIGEQLDEIFHDIEAWKTRLSNVENKYPKK